MGRTCSWNGEKRSMCRLLIRKSGGKRSLGRSRLRKLEKLRWILERMLWRRLGWSISL
jgi:hypothetical protein